MLYQDFQEPKLIDRSFCCQIRSCGSEHQKRRRFLELCKRERQIINSHGCTRFVQKGLTDWLGTDLAHRWLSALRTFFSWLCYQRLCLSWAFSLRCIAFFKMLWRYDMKSFLLKLASSKLSKLQSFPKLLNLKGKGLYTFRARLGLFSIFIINFCMQSLIFLSLI